MLVEFASVVEAVRCAVEVNEAMAKRNADVPKERRIEFRVGINVGDIIIDEGDILGDGVNIAARLEGIAQPGSIFLSKAARDQVRDKLDIVFEDMGEHSLKNIARPVHVYRVAAHPLQAEATEKRLALPLPDKPSLAVLPFQNMSGDPEQEYFADGMVEEIITALSHVRSFFVIARNSSFTYKGRSVDVKQVGRELGVRYVLEGSVRKAGGRVRITCQLIEAVTNHHVWADRFEDGLEDVFALQDRIAQSVVGAIEPSLQLAEVDRASRTRPEDLTAYDLYLRALPHAHSLTAIGIERALEILNRAISQEPTFAQAHGMVGWCHGWLKASGYKRRPDNDATGMSHVERALSLDPNDAAILVTAGWCALFLAREHDRGLELTTRSVALNPNSAIGWAYHGWVQYFCDAPADQVIPSFEKAMRLSPLDPQRFISEAGIGQAQHRAGRYEEAIEWQMRALRQNRNINALWRNLASCFVRLGRWDEARHAARKILEASPEFAVSKWRDEMATRHGPQTEQFLSDLLLAGIPE
jgi:adenylate cyclase